MPITWSHTLETGIRQLDLQHQELVDIINQLELAPDAPTFWGRAIKYTGEFFRRQSLTMETVASLEQSSTIINASTCGAMRSINSAMPSASLYAGINAINLFWDLES